MFELWEGRAVTEVKRSHRRLGPDLRPRPPVLVVKRSDLMACPIHALGADHYYLDDEGKVKCRCKT